MKIGLRRTEERSQPPAHLYKQSDRFSPHAESRNRADRVRPKNVRQSDDTFDPYHKWLRFLPSGGQSHYSLLGISRTGKDPGSLRRGHPAVLHVALRLGPQSELPAVLNKLPAAACCSIREAKRVRRDVANQARAEVRDRRPCRKDCNNGLLMVPAAGRRPRNVALVASG